MERYRNLISRVRQVRRKWRLQMAVKGLSLFLTLAVALLLFGVWGADLFGFRPAAVWFFRAFTTAAMLLVAARFLYLPLRRRIPDVQIARFIEERYPHLEDRLVSAVEFSQDPRMSPGMLNLLITDTLDKTSRLDFSVFVNRRRLLSYGGLAGGAFAVLLVLLNWGPSFFPYGFNELYVPWTHASIGAPVMIQVLPGNAEVARGSDQQVKAQLVGFDSPDVKLYVQPESVSSWMPLAMEPESRGSGFAYLLIDLQASTRYYVEAKGVRSPTYAFKVIDIPKVEKIDLLYNFPAYTGMAPQKVENEGDISALKGTRVDLKIKLNQPARSARLLFDDQTTLDLVSQGGQEFDGSLTLKRSGSYVVDIEDASGKRHPGSEYEIEAIDDEPPKVTIEKPMRDVRATNVEEVFSQLRAEDDIGVAKLELHYSVNGAPEKSVKLYDRKPSEMEVTSSHTFFLEEYGLQPGDVVSYYGKAWDNNDATGPGTSSSDIYFIEIRPFEQNYRQSQQGRGSQGGAGAGDSADALSAQQKEIISATFKLIREQSGMTPKEYQDGLKALALVQSRLQVQTKDLIDRLERRGAVQVSEDFGKLVDYLKTAVSEMEKAAVQLGAQQPSEALPAEEKSLQQLMRAESLFRDIQVSFESGGGGAGRGSQERAKDLADLTELQMNKLKNQYETIQRGEQQARDEKLDEALQKLKELARRQQQLNEKNGMAAGPRGSSSSGGGGESQAQLTQDLQELQRQLQRLSRERSSPDLNQASSQLQRAIDELKKSAERSRQGNGQETGAQGIRALQQLEDARRALERNQNAGLQRGLEDAVNESKRMVEEQNKIQEGINRLVQQKQQGGGTDAQQLGKDLADRKSALADRVKGLAGKIDDLSRQARRDQKETFAKLNEAAGTIRDQRLPERILSGNQLLNGGYYEFMKGREDSIRGSLENLNRQLEAARSGIGQTREAKLEEALRKTRQLSQSLDSAQKRLQNSGQRQGESGQRETGRQGQQGEQAQAGQPGRGQQSQTGQPGQQGGQGQQAQGGNPRDSQGLGRPTRAGGRPGDQVGEPSLGGSGPPRGGRYNEEEARQIQRQLAQGLMDAEELRRSIERNSNDSRNLGQVIDELRNMNEHDPRAFYDPQQLALLKQSIDLLHQVELSLGRELDRLTVKDKYFYAEDNEAPAQYKKLVEEYYKALATVKK